MPVFSTAALYTIKASDTAPLKATLGTTIFDAYFFVQPLFIH